MMSGARVVVATRFLFVLIAATWLAGCVHRPDGPSWPASDGVETCCIDIDPETMPPWFIATIEPAAPVIGRVIGNIVWRDGYLARDDALQRIQAELLPLDVVVVSSKGRLSGHTLPGLFAHFATYLGTEADLRRAGLWNDPRVVPHHRAIRAGRTFIEADQYGVHLSRPDTVFNADRAVVLRPRGLSAARKRRATLDFLEHVGTRFDFNFDNADTSRLYCAQLVCHVLPELRLPSREVYGRRTIVPDDVLLQVARGRLPLSPRLYVRARAEGWEIASARILVADIARHWQK